MRYEYKLQESVERRSLPSSSVQSLSPLELCLARKSVRAYDPTKSIPEEILQTIRDHVSNDSNLIGPMGTRVRIELVSTNELSSGKLGTYGVISGASHFLVGILPEKANEFDHGFVFEKVILLCTQLGLGTCWLGGTFSKANFLQAVKLKEGEKILVVSPVGYGLSQPKTLIQNMMQQMMGKSGHRHAFNRIFFRPASDKTPKSATDLIGVEPDEKIFPSSLMDALHAARWAPSAINAQGNRYIVEAQTDNPNKYIVHCFFDLSHHRPHNDAGIAVSHLDFLTHSSTPGRIIIDPKIAKDIPTITFPPCHDALKEREEKKIWTYCCSWIQQ